MIHLSLLAFSVPGPAREHLRHHFVTRYGESILLPTPPPPPPPPPRPPRSLDRRILLLGAIQGLFEGSMYTFIFLWTPALSPNDEHIPHGLIFATFMVACMAGSALAGILMAKGMLPEYYMQVGHGMARHLILGTTSHLKDVPACSDAFHHPLNPHPLRIPILPPPTSPSLSAPLG